MQISVDKNICELSQKAEVFSNLGKTKRKILSGIWQTTSAPRTTVNSVCPQIYLLNYWYTDYEWMAETIYRCGEGENSPKGRDLYTYIWAKIMDIMIKNPRFPETA